MTRGRNQEEKGKRGSRQTKLSKPIEQTKWANLPPELLLDIVQHVEASKTHWPAQRDVIAYASGDYERDRQDSRAIWLAYLPCLTPHGPGFARAPHRPYTDQAFQRGSGLQDGDFAEIPQKLYQKMAFKTSNPKDGDFAEIQAPRHAVRHGLEPDAKPAVEPLDPTPPPQTHLAHFLKSKIQSLESRSRETLQALDHSEASIPERESSAVARIEEQNTVTFAEVEKNVSRDLDLQIHF
ncbi:hypothetical protein DVH24_024212 [Malus domestica]|uniref:Uncharacterized protein n=1 Tax=Malus domestica TaxID=3750 RepID=A0A498JFT4_MALDO|nr:hypothetical protein DVH24_024212 [Malus domestica]